jgi:arylsulfatase A-like enzyme
MRASHNLVALLIHCLLAGATLATSFGCRRSLDDEMPFFFVEHVSEADAEYNRARFQSFRKDGLLAAPMTLRGETRQSLTPPLPSNLSIHVRVPPEAVLRFAIAVQNLSDVDAWPPTEFRLSVVDGDQTETLFLEVLDRSQPNRWMDREVDLARWSGKTIRVDFRTRIDRPGNRSPWTARRILPLWGNPVLVGAARRRERPNLVLISIDCLRADHVGAYGYPRDTTPHIDRLAADGVVFETAVATSSWTLPTHMSMFTGLAPSFHGATKWEKLDRSIPYFPELLADGGYYTSGVASWVYVSQTYGFERGYHVYQTLEDLDTRAGDVIDVAIEQARRAKGTDQFLFVHLFDPHWPYLPPPEFLERFGPRPRDLSGLDDILGSDAPADELETEEIIRLYDAEVAYTDSQLGRFFDELKAAGLYDSSLIVLTSDHGEAFFEHGHWQHTLTLYNELVNVPLIVKWPDDSPKGRVSRPVSQLDIFASILEAAGVSAPETPSMSVSLKRLAKENRPEPAVSEVTWRSAEGMTMKISIRSDDLKYHASLSGPAENSLEALELENEELYDLGNDPREEQNLLPDPGIDVESFRRRMRSLLERARELRSGHSAGKVVLDDEIRERLRALGYVDPM